MKNDSRNKTKRSLTRRDFAKRSIIILAGAGTAGLVGYGLFNTKKIRTIHNRLRMGHCAPTVMQTLLGINGIQNPDMVKYAAGLAGGIAGSEMECGVLTAPLMFMGYSKSDLTGINEKLNIIRQAQSYIKEFNEFNGTTICKNILQSESCRHVINNFHKPYSRAIKNPVILSDDVEEAYTLLLETFDEKKFHCAHNVLKNINNNFNITEELYASSWPFIGGIALLNRTCGALAAGAMALSSATARIAYSYSGVARLNRLLKENDSKAMDEETNSFNRSITLCDELGSWFRNRYGSTTCHELCGLSFSDITDVKSYLSGPCMGYCSDIALEVAEKVSTMI